MMISTYPILPGEDLGVEKVGMELKMRRESQMVWLQELGMLI